MGKRVKTSEGGGQDEQRIGVLYTLGNTQQDATEWPCGELNGVILSKHSKHESNAVTSYYSERRPTIIRAWASWPNEEPP